MLKNRLARVTPKQSEMGVEIVEDNHSSADRTSMSY